VERLSKLIETRPAEMLKDETRLAIINSAVNIDKRLVKLYDLIENDLLGSLQYSVSDIAPYTGPKVRERPGLNVGNGTLR
jgi:Ariadne domain